MRSFGFPQPAGRHRAVRATLSGLALVVIALALGLLLAAGLGIGVWGIAAALHHAANS